MLKDIEAGNKYKAKFPIYCKLENEEVIDDPESIWDQYDVNVASVAQNEIVTLEGIQSSWFDDEVIVVNAKKQTLSMYYEQFINSFKEEEQLMRATDLTELEKMQMCANNSNNLYKSINQYKRMTQKELRIIYEDSQRGILEILGKNPLENYEEWSYSYAEKAMKLWGETKVKIKEGEL